MTAGISGSQAQNVKGKRDKKENQIFRTAKHKGKTQPVPSCLKNSSGKLIAGEQKIKDRRYIEAVYGKIDERRILLGS